MYSVLRIILLAFFKCFFRLEVRGLHNIPRDGAAIIASNHVSLWDPPAIGVNISRYTHFMAKEELFQIPIFSWIIKRLKAFPVRRGSADRVAIRTAIELLSQGEIVAVFPEGTRSLSGQLGKPEPGVALIALKSGAPIIPTAVLGTHKSLRNESGLPKFKVIFGAPILSPAGKTGRESMDELSTAMMKEITRLMEEGK